MKFYSGIAGNNPAIPGSEQGGVEVDVLNVVSRTGYALDNS